MCPDNCFLSAPWPHSHREDWLRLALWHLAWHLRCLIKSLYLLWETSPMHPPLPPQFSGVTYSQWQSALSQLIFPFGSWSHRAFEERLRCRVCTPKAHTAEGLRTGARTAGGLRTGRARKWVCTPGRARQPVSSTVGGNADLIFLFRSS